MSKYTTSRKRLDGRKLHAYRLALLDPTMNNTVEREPWRETRGGQRGERDAARAVVSAVLRQEGTLPLPADIFLTEAQIKEFCTAAVATVIHSEADLVA